MGEETGLYYYGARYYNPRESIFLSVDPMAEMMPNVSPYAYTLQNPVKFIDPTGMLPEDGGGDPPTGKRDIYDSTPTKDGGRKLTKTKTVSSGSDQNDAFVNVVDKDGYSIKAYTGANAVAEYTNDYGLPSDVEMIMSDGLNGFERTLFAIRDVSYIALTNTETNTIIFAPLEEFVLGEIAIGRLLSSSSKMSKVGHLTPWSQMTKAEKRAFQHSYSRHFKELDLPIWKESQASSLQKLFNNKVSFIKSQGTSGRNKFFESTEWINGVQQKVNRAEPVINGQRYFYYETKGGKFISAGRMP